MAFTYSFTTDPTVANVRLLISDTQEFAGSPPIRINMFEDDEITAFYAIQAGTWQSAQFYSDNAGRYLPSSPVSLLRVAALALDSLANNSNRLSAIKKLLDVELDVSQAAANYRATAEQYRCIDDDSGAFAIIEQTPTIWAYKQRYWNEVARQSA